MTVKDTLVAEIGGSNSRHSGLFKFEEFFVVVSVGWDGFVSCPFK